MLFFSFLCSFFCLSFALFQRFSLCGAFVSLFVVCSMALLLPFFVLFVALFCGFFALCHVLFLFYRMFGPFCRFFGLFFQLHFFIHCFSLVLVAFNHFGFFLSPFFQCFFSSSVFTFSAFLSPLLSPKL